jgi:NitT/TauT family transport system ATP-binding protein
MVFQEPRLLPWRTVEENVRLVAPELDETKFSALLSLLHLQEHRFHFPGELSLGLARRTSLARAFAIDPDLLILDEPLVSLDSALAAHLRDEIAAVVDSHGVTAVLVTHSLEDAVSLGNRVFVLSPRPAQILAEMRIGTPRMARTASRLTELKAELSHLARTGRP